ncbi:MAG: sigma 54-interacting transcriptional regulator [Planctomycetota bacterium]
MSDAFHLCWINHAGGELVYQVRGSMTVGRAPENEISVDEEGVSRRHCRLELRESGLFLEDLGSTNGTFVNGKRVVQADVGEGDEILVGRSLFRVQGGTGRCATAETLRIGRETIELTLKAGREEYPGSLGSGSQAADHLRTLCRVMDAVNAGSSSEELYRQVLDSILATLDMDFGAVLLGSDPAAPAVLAASRRGKAHPALSTTVLGTVLRNGEAVLANDIQGDARFSGSTSLAGEVATRILSAPIAFSGNILGALYFTSDSRDLPVAESDLRLVTLVGRQLALAADKLRRQELVLEENRSLRAAMVGDLEIVGSSDALQQAQEMTRRAARADVTVLITGETGTGKELFARAVHEWSPRAGQPFIAVNCGAIPQAMVESELFGHERGAFTGAVERRIGRFELAREGTLFLDEVGELPLDLQVKLLRVLEEKRFFRVGGSKEIRSDVRVVAATNRDLLRLVEAGEFRKDLLYRIRVLEIGIPPLRERVRDILEIAEHLLGGLSRESGLSPRRLSPEAKRRMEAYSWPGNVRELRNVLERALILSSSDTISADEILPRTALETGGAPAACGSQRSLRDVEKEHIRAVLVATGWNKSRAAEILGIGRTNIYEKIKQYGLESTS